MLGNVANPADEQLRAEIREPRAESREPRAESREPRAESREPRAESREPRAESREPRAERPSSCPPGRLMPRSSAARRSAPTEFSPPAPGGYPSERSADPAAGRRATSFRLRGLFRSGTVRALAALLVLAGLAVLAARPAQAQTTLVSNLGQTLADNHHVNNDRGQAFTAGTAAVLSSVDIERIDNDGSTFSAAIWSTTGDGKPDSLLYSLTAPGSFFQWHPEVHRTGQRNTRCQYDLYSRVGR